MTGDFTTIRISKKMRDKLKALGKKGETYDEIIERMFTVLEEREKCTR
ncbi:MAG: hypothetical protein OEY22_08335 [Candidatus Bathyarchaeota archaeon]|nr:hypothetical protein [Candidatus Bathyarchaeota archaeon]